MIRQAIVRGRAYELKMIQRYLPSNYVAFTFGNDVIIEGEDYAGWTLEDYVIPRLRSGNIIAIYRG